MYPTAQEEYKLVRNGHPGCTGLKLHGTDRPEGTGVRTGRQEVVVLQAWFSIHSVLHHDFKTCSSASCALFCQLVAMEKWIGARNFILLCQHFWTYQLPSAPVQTEGARMALFSDSVSIGTGVVMFPEALTAFIHAVTELLTLSALCAWHCAVPHWGNLPACPAAASLCLPSSASLFQPLELFV